MLVTRGESWFFSLSSFPKPFSTTAGKERSLKGNVGISFLGNLIQDLKVCPVGAVSKTTTEKSILFTSFITSA